MPKFAMLTRLAAGAARSPHALEELEHRTATRIQYECPEVEWLQSYALLGRDDYLDLFEAPDNEAAAKVAVLVRSIGHAQTEVWPLMEWDRFKGMLRSLKATQRE
jgi:uncharacterized protein with GYD domain